jgi:hypothetical protein
MYRPLARCNLPHLSTKLLGDMSKQALCSQSWIRQDPNKAFPHLQAPLGVLCLSLSCPPAYCLTLRSRPAQNTLLTLLQQRKGVTRLRWLPSSIIVVPHISVTM